MSYAFDMSFAMAADEKEAFVLARHYVEKCMEKKNARKFIEDNTKMLQIGTGSKIFSNSAFCIGRNISY